MYGLLRARDDDQRLAERALEALTQVADAPRQELRYGNGGAAADAARDRDGTPARTASLDRVREREDDRRAMQRRTLRVRDQRTERFDVSVPIARPAHESRDKGK